MNGRAPTLEAFSVQRSLNGYSEWNHTPSAVRGQSPLLGSR